VFDLVDHWVVLKGAEKVDLTGLYWAGHLVVQMVL